MDIKIRTLSPLHIGDGEEITSINSIYLQGKNKTIVVNEKEIFKLMDSEMKLRFRDWLENNMIKVEMDKKFIPDLKEFIEKTENKKLQNSLEKKENILYEIDGGFKKNLKTTIKIQNKIYISGSEIKGAIRTAVIYKFLKDNKDEYDKFLKKLLDFYNSEILIGKFEKILVKKIIEGVADKNKTIKDIFINGKKYTKNKLKENLVKEIAKITSNIETTVFNTLNNDAKYDIFKYLIIGDSELKDVEINCEIKKIDTIGTFAPDNAEFIKPNKEFALKINIADIEKIISKIGDKQKLSKEMEKKKINISLEFIKEALYEYAEDILKSEEEYSEYGKHDISIKTKIQNIKNSNSKENPLIRLGKYKGYLSETISLLVRNRDRKFFDEFLSHCTKGTSYFENTVGEIFPKTRRISGNETFGWCKLIFEEESLEKKEIKNTPSLSVTIKKLKILEVDNQYFYLEENKKVKVDDFMRGKSTALRANLKNLKGKIFKVKDKGEEITEFIEMG